jgi:hypothetical protein
MTKRKPALQEILDAQRLWAETAGIEVDLNGYVRLRKENLFRELSAQVEKSLRSGAGSELDPRDGAPPKFHALHSSSALVVNVFAYWEDSSLRPLTEALGIGPASGPPEFERTFETGLRGTAPHLDVVFPLATNELFAIESKFTEWLTPKSRSKPPFRAAYLSAGRNLWSTLGLQKCQQLAQDIQDRRQVFEHLDAPQLLKHALGLANQTGAGFSLGYLYFDWDGDEGESHRQEIEQFRRRVGEEIQFVPVSYQTLFRRLSTTCGSGHIEYLTYLRERY